MTQATIEKSIEVDAPAAARVEGEFGPDAVVSFKDQDGTGLKGQVVDYSPGRSLRIEYIAEYFKDVESADASREATWIGRSEAYEVTEQQGRSTLSVHQTLPASDADHFDQAWDKALARIKEIAEL